MSEMSYSINLSYRIMSMFCGVGFMQCVHVVCPMRFVLCVLSSNMVALVLTVDALCFVHMLPYVPGMVCLFGISCVWRVFDAR